jgi:hypothetical protein
MVDSLLRSNKRSPQSRLGRTIVLGAVTVTLAIVWLADTWGVERDELWGYFLTSLLFVAVFVGVGMTAGGLVWLLKKYLR